MKVLSTGATTLLVAGLLALPAAAEAQSAGRSAGPSLAQALQCKGRKATIVGTNGPDTLLGTGEKDVIVALGGDDRIKGRGGNDIICGGSGRDFVDGGPGDDKLFGGADGRSEARNADGVRLVVGDVIEGGKGDDLIDLGYDPRQLRFGSAVRDRLSYQDAKFPVTLDLGTPRGRGHAKGEGQDLLVKHPYLSVIGSAQGDTINGSPWDDEVFGRGGSDVVNAGPGADRLVDGVAGEKSGDDVLRGGLGNDALTSYGGHDHLDGGGAGDLITLDRPGAGQVTLAGGPGNDVFTLKSIVAPACIDVRGGAGADELVPTVLRAVRKGKVDADLQSGAFGLRRPAGDSCGIIAAVETLTLDNPYGQNLRWFVRGTSAAETVMLSNGANQGASILATMGGGDDRVVASSGDDNLKGGPGDDRLFGGEGRDVAEGGRGTDTCRQAEFEKGCELP